MPRSAIKLILLLLLPVVVLLGAGFGSISISPSEVGAICLRRIGVSGLPAVDSVKEAVLLNIRLPRVVLAVLIGGSLAVCGAGLQGLYRNPLADPALIGISSGASFAAVSAIVAGQVLLQMLPGLTGLYLVELATFIGALVSTVLVYMLALRQGRILVPVMLMAGIGVNALAMAGTGIFTFGANDAQLRSITFWTLGSLGGASWNQVLAVLPFTFGAVITLPLLGKALNAFALDERNAAHLGFRVERIKRVVMIAAALAVGASVAAAGIIAFVGLLVPNILRILLGPDHRALLPYSAIGGAVLLVSADLLARTGFGASEMPIGIITACCGGPFFIYLLLRERGRGGAFA